MIKVVLPLCVGMVLCLPQCGSAQFSSDIPGVPRAMLPQQGGRQNRFELELEGFRGDTVAGRGRFALGQSFRVGAFLEIGYDLTIAEGLLLHPPQDSSLGAQSSSSYTRGTFGYGFRAGAKVQPISYVSPEGYGYSLSLGAAVQPALKPVFSVAGQHDTVTTGGLLSKKKDSPFGSLPLATDLAAMFSYRSPRVTADLALLHETVGVVDLASVSSYPGTVVKAGALYRVLPNLALGVSWWGNGAPPWRDRTVLQSINEKAAKFGIDLGFGSRPEAGTDIMIVSPTGDLVRSARFYLRVRTTT